LLSFFALLGPCRDLPSFPTRRSSDLGPDWSDMMIRLAAAGPSPWVIYSVASAAMVVILVATFLVGSWLQIGALAPQPIDTHVPQDRKSTRLNSSHVSISYAVFCLKKK